MRSRRGRSDVRGELLPCARVSLTHAPGEVETHWQRPVVGSYLVPSSQRTLNRKCDKMGQHAPLSAAMRGSMLQLAADEMQNGTMVAPLHLHSGNLSWRDVERAIQEAASRAAESSVQLIQVVGSDALVRKAIQRLASTGSIVCVLNRTVEPEYADLLALVPQENLIDARGQVQESSSTRIRELVRRGQDVTGMMPDSVIQYHCANGITYSCLDKAAQNKTAQKPRAQSTADVIMNDSVVIVRNKQPAPTVELDDAAVRETICRAGLRLVESPFAADLEATSRNSTDRTAPNNPQTIGPDSTTTSSPFPNGPEIIGAGMSASIVAVSSTAAAKVFRCRKAWVIRAFEAELRLYGFFQQAAASSSSATPPPAFPLCYGAGTARMA
eukprot:1420620-Rhodomonas_salina.1